MVIAVSSIAAQSGSASTGVPAEHEVAPHEPARAFDVVSIRPGDPKSDFSMMGNPSASGEFRSMNLPIGAVISRAYFPMAYGSRDQIQGAPAWIWDEKYDFVGKVASADLPEWQTNARNWSSTVPNKMLQAMLRVALQERCKMVAHEVPSQMTGYALVVDKHGPNLKNLHATIPDETIPSEALSLAQGGRMIPSPRGSENPTVHFYQTSMKSFAAMLSTWGAPVEDRSGLLGAYDFSLVKWSPGDSLDRAWDFGALGLKLVPIKVPSVAIVIDHIERPTPN